MWCFDQSNDERAIANDIKDCIKPCIRPQKFEADLTNETRAAEYAEDIRKAYSQFEADAIITHDALFQSSYIDVSRATHWITVAVDGPMKDVVWLHWLHSMVGPLVQEVNEHTKYRLTVPEGHFLVYPNEADIKNVVRRYNTERQWVFSCPNPRDPRTLWASSPVTRKLVKGLSLLERDIVQVYPVCSTRVDGKGLPVLIELFGAMKKQGRRVCLLVPNSNAGGEREKKKLLELRAGSLLTEDELVFTSEILPPEFETSGVPNKMVQELFQFSNLFLFPSLAEACPLILAEAQMAGCVCIVNANVPAMVEYTSNETLRLTLPAHARSVDYRTKGQRKVGDEWKEVDLAGEDARKAYIEEVAGRILQRVEGDVTVQQKRTAMRTFSWESVGQRLVEIVEVARVRKQRYASINT